MFRMVHIIDSKILKIPRLGVIGYHPSDLPKKQRKTSNNLVNRAWDLEKLHQPSSNE